MRVELLGVDSPVWIALLEEVDHDFYHLPTYGALCADLETGICKALFVEEGARRLLLPIIVRDLPAGRHDAVSPYGYPGPLISGTESATFMSDALANGIAALREEGFVSAFIRLHPLLNPTVPEGIGTLVEHGATVSVDLDLPEDVIWRQTRRGHRHEIARSIRLGCVARMDEDWALLATFRRLYEQTMIRRSAEPRYLFDDHYFGALRDALGDRLHLCVVETGGAIAAAGLFVETCGIVEYHLSGSDDAYQSLRPTKLMIHFVEGWARPRGNRRLHLGGGVGGRTDSLYEFKAGFSPLRHRFRTLRVIIDKTQYRELVAARDASDDPNDQTGFFPIYRHF